jgi:Cu-processing system permease protein
MHPVRLVAKLTFRESLRNKWVTYFSVAFAILALLLSLVGSGETTVLSSFDRSAAMLLNILLLFVPLLGFALGAQLIAADRESGALVYLLSQPVTKRQLFFGKALGATLAMIVSVSGGFAVAGLGIALSGGDGFAGFAVLWASALLFVLVCISIGMLISVLSANRSRAIGVALLAWFVFTILSDLGLMGTAYVLRLRSEGIVGMALLNPVEAFKILAVRLLANDLEALGAGGVYLDFIVGGLLPLLLAIWLLATMGLALAGGYWLFSHQEEV